MTTKLKLSDMTGYEAESAPDFMAPDAYRNGFSAGYREAQFELKRRVRTVSTDLDGIDYACAVLQLVREFLP